MRVLVSGGGIGGLTAAIALTQRGIAVDLVERGATWETRGAGITINPNGDRVFRDLGLDNEVADAGFRIERLQLMDAAGGSIGEFPFGPWPGVGGAIAIHRDALQRVLVKAASRASLMLGRTVTHVDDGGSAVRVTFDDGSLAQYDVLVVAEGIRSTTRAAIFGPVHVRSVGQMYWRTAVPERLVDVLTMVADEGRFVSVIPLDDTWTYIAVQTHSEPISVASSERIVSMRAATAGMAGPVSAGIDALRSDDDVFVGPAEEVTDVHWRRSRVVLIGDAAHALSPAFGQGANLALEDAYVLAEELASTDDIDHALDAFVARRESRVAFVQAKSEERIALVNRGASQRDLLAATQLVEAHLSKPI
jgi:2-polyprenyl-6-methoxyphenol hydroxylase-like FAD-dependent oxidoreductase